MKKTVLAFLIFFCFAAIISAAPTQPSKDSASKPAVKSNSKKESAKKSNAESSKTEKVSGSKQKTDKKPAVDSAKQNKNSKTDGNKKTDGKSAKENKSNAKKEQPQETPKPKDWMKNDDIIIVHYPVNCRTIASLKEVFDSSRWKEFTSDFFKNFERSYKKTVSKSEQAAKADRWIRSQVAKELGKTNATSQEMINAYYRHVILVLSVKNIDLTAGLSQLSSSGYYAAVVDFNPTADQEVRNFLTNDLKGKIIRQTKDCFAVYFPIPQKHIALASVKVPGTPFYAVVYEENEKSLLNKLDSNWIEKILVPLVNGRKEKINAVYINLTIFKKIVQCVNENMPGFKNNLTLKNICERLDTVAYSVEMNNDSGISLSLNASAVNKESAKEINDLLVGFVALTKLQGNQNPKKNDNGRQVALDAVKLLEVEQKENNVFISLNLSKEEVKKNIDILLGDLSKKIKSKLNKDVFKKSGKQISDTVLQFKDDLKKKVQEKVSKENQKKESN